ncbi:hypothetical protein D9M71_608660 [compost metagenome]
MPGIEQQSEDFVLVVLQQGLQMSEDPLWIGQRSALGQALAGQLLGHVQDVGLGDRRLHDVGAGHFPSSEFVEFHR